MVGFLREHRKNNEYTGNGHSTEQNIDGGPFFLKKNYGFCKEIGKNLKKKFVAQRQNFNRVDSETEMKLGHFC